MSTQPEILIGQIAVEAGLVTPEQLAQCIIEQESAPGDPLGVIMIRRGFLKREDLDALLHEQQKRLSEALDLSDPRIEDALLGRLLIRQGLATESQVFECLRLQARMTEEGKLAPRLGEFLVERHYIASDAMDTALILRKKEVFHCPSCSVTYSTMGADPGRKYTCKNCGCILEREERVFRPGETTGALRVDMPDDAAAHAKDPDRRFAAGRYILIEEVGHGGMGVVWKAWQTDLRRYVAIKLLAGTGWTDQDLRRFHREAQTAASLSHSNIASIYEVGIEAGRHFLAMEFVEGDTLAHVLAPPSRAGTQRRAPTLRRGVEIVREAALAVEYAHSKGIIHRDIKPSNIMVTKQGGRTYVMDFGLARPVRDQETVTVSEAIVGTPSYMPPEQARGSSVDQRSDVYSLGAVLYVVLTGRPPYSGRSPADTLMKVISDDPVPPRQVNGRIHEDIETICLKALEKDRNRRYESARAFADDLARYLEGEPIAARPVSLRERAWKLARRKPVAALLAAAAPAAILCLVVAIVIMNARLSSRVEGFVRDGDHAMARGQYDEARRNYDRALALDPDHAFALRKRQQCEKALEGRKPPPVPSNLKEIADALFDAKAWEKALAQYRRMLDQNPGSEWALERRRQCEAAIEKAKSEERDREEARTLERQRAQRRERALPAYETGRVAFDAASHLKGQEMLQRYREALDALGRAIREDDSYAEAWHLRGVVRFRIADYANAEQDFQGALRAMPSFASAAFQLAVLHEVRYQLTSRCPYVKSPEDLKSALAGQQKAIDQVMAMTSPAYERWSSKALSHLHARRFDEALEALDKVRSEGAGLYPPVLLRAIIHLEAGNDAQALPLFIAAVEMEPGSFEALFLRALLRDRLDDLDGALEDATRVVELAPEIYLAFLLRGYIHQRRGDVRKSRLDLEKAARIEGAPVDQIQDALANLK